MEILNQVQDDEVMAYDNGEAVRNDPSSPSASVYACAIPGNAIMGATRSSTRLNWRPSKQPRSSSAPGFAKIYTKRPRVIKHGVTHMWENGRGKIDREN